MKATAVILVLSFASTAAAQTPPAFTATTHTLPTFAMRTYARDVNHDGRPDLLLMSIQPGSMYAFPYDIGVMLGTASGTLGPLMPLGINSILDFDCGDVNGDGNLDIVAVGFGQIETWLGVGDGTFTGPMFTTPILGNQSNRVRLVDFDNDMNLDAFLVLRTSTKFSDVYLALGTGSGGFQAATKVSQFLHFAPSVGVFDINLDGKLDATVSGLPYCGYCAPGPQQQPPMIVYLANSTGSGFTYILYAEPNYAVQMEGADVTSDGVPDLTFVEGGGPKLTIRNPTPAGLTPIASATMDGGITKYEFTDFDGDGLQDVLAFTSQTQTQYSMSIAMGTSPTTWAPAVSVVAMQSNYNIDFAVADFDVDGRMDFVVPSMWAPTITQCRQNYASPSGIVAYGTGTPGCSGAVALDAVGSLSASQNGITITASNAPASATGLFFFGDAFANPGVDSLFTGALLHVDLFQSTIVASAPMVSQSGGTASLFIPGQPSPQIIGTTLFAQAAFVEPPTSQCSGALAGIVTSRGLSITIQP
jgi:hypothetical protein